MDTPPSVETPVSGNASVIGKLKLAVIGCFVLGILIPLTGIPGVGGLLLLGALVCSILCIVKGARPFGIVMLIVTVLIGGPACCTTSVWGNKELRTGISSGVDQMKLQAELRDRLHKAQAEGDGKAVQEIADQIKEESAKHEKELQQLMFK